MTAFAGVALSQILIIIFWQDAKFGTIANIIILAVAVPAFASWNFNLQVESEVRSLLKNVGSSEKTIVTREMISHLPLAVQDWLKQSNVIGKEMIHTVHLKQKGTLRTTTDGKWMPVKAEQYITTGKPGFIWQARIQAFPLIHISGRDKYQHGKGNMLIKLLSLITVADSRGKEIDQGALLRFLGEVVWCPTAALSDYISWEEIDSTSARATMSYGGISASGVFTFNEKGQVSGFEANRYYDRNGNFTLEKWHVEVKNYRTMDGIRIPAGAEVTWKLKSGDFTWYKFEITDLFYNSETSDFSDTPVPKH